MRLGRYQSTSAPSVRSARTRIAVEQIAVDVVVAVHGDARAPRDVAEDRPGAVAQAAEGVERVRLLRGQEPLRRRRIAEPAAHEHLREHVRDPELATELLGRGEVVGGDVEAGFLAAHGREAMAAGGRKAAPGHRAAPCSSRRAPMLAPTRSGR